jgi:hypothetical protein
MADAIDIKVIKEIFMPVISAGDNIFHITNNLENLYWKDS